MSGRKRATVSLSNDDRKRLQAASERLSQVEHDYNELRQRIQQFNNQENQASYHELEARQQGINHSLAGMNQQLMAIEIQTSQALLEQAADFHQQNLITGTAIWDQTNQLLNQHSASVYAAIEASQGARQAEFLRLNNALIHQKNQTQSKKRAARSMIQAAAILYQALETAYHDEPKAFKQLQEFQNAIELAASNLESDFSEAALVAAQQAYHGLSNLRGEMEVIIQQRGYLFTLASAKAHEVKEIIEKNQHIRAMDLDGNLLEIQIDTDFWSEGRLGYLDEIIQQIETALNRPVQELETENLAAYIQVCEQVETEIIQSVHQARLNAISSQVRFNIAECVVGALKEQGFTLENSEYGGDDMRNQYSMVLADFEGNEVSIEISPVPGEIIDHNLEMVSHDKDLRTEHELRQRGKELATSLRGFGLQIGRISGAPVGASLPTSQEPAKFVRESPPPTYHINKRIPGHKTD